MDSKPDSMHGIINDRLRFVDVLVKAGRFGDAIREIAEIRQADPANPYAEAYEERLRATKSEQHSHADSPATDTVDPIQNVSPELIVPASISTGRRSETEDLTDGESNEVESWLRALESQPPKIDNSSERVRIPHNTSSRGKANIVIVDDDELLLMALVELLEDNKYRTNSFTRAEDAFEYVKGHRPDLVLCDVNFTNSTFGGFTLFENMSKLGHLHNVPFLFMSGLADTAIIRAGKELGADDYLTKPIEPEMLLSVVKGKLRKYKMIERNH
jgi:CheY-like chemotaxis protein